MLATLIHSLIITYNSIYYIIHDYIYHLLRNTSISLQGWYRYARIIWIRTAPLVKPHFFSPSKIGSSLLTLFGSPLYFPLRHMYTFAHTEIDLDAKTFDSPWIFNMWTLRRPCKRKKTSIYFAWTKYVRAKSRLKCKWKPAARSITNVDRDTATDTQNESTFEFVRGMQNTNKGRAKWIGHEEFYW